MPKMLWACDHCSDIFSGSDAWEKAKQHEEQVCKTLRDKNDRDRERIVGLVRSVLQQELAGALRQELEKAQKRVLRRVQRTRPQAKPEMGLHAMKTLPLAERWDRAVAEYLERQGCGCGVVSSTRGAVDPLSQVTLLPGPRPGESPEAGREYTVVKWPPGRAACRTCQVNLRPRIQPRRYAECLACHDVVKGRFLLPAEAA